MAQTSLGALRVKLGHDLDLINKDAYEFLWVTDFPMFEYDENENRYVAAHHPFTSPNLEDVDKLMSDPAHCYSRAYDLVLNGYELLSGSIRIHDQKLQEKVFEAIGMTLEEAHEKIQLVYGCVPIWNSTSWRCRYRSRTFNNDFSGYRQHS